MQTLLNLYKIVAKIKNHNFIELYKQNEKKKEQNNPKFRFTEN